MESEERRRLDRIWERKERLSYEKNQLGSRPLTGSRVSQNLEDGHESERHRKRSKGVKISYFVRSRMSWTNKVKIFINQSEERLTEKTRESKLNRILQIPPGPLLPLRLF